MAAKRKAKEPDWKKIAHELAARCVFVVTYIRQAGDSGLVFNTKTGDSRHWRDYVAEGIEMMPGVTVDREKLALMGLPRVKRGKALAELEKRRAAEKQKSTTP